MFGSSGGEDSLLARYVYYSVSAVVIAVLLMLNYAPAGAQDPSAGEAIFFGVKKSDRVGKLSAKPDGKPDAVFALNLKPRAATGTIAEVEVRSIEGQPGIWNTIPGKAVGAGYVGAARAKTPADIINKTPGPLNLNGKQENDLLLFVTDDGAFSHPDRHYQIKVSYSDGTSIVVPVRTEISSAPEDVQVKPGVFPVRMSAVLKGISNYDAVNPTKRIGGDDVADGLFELKVDAPNKEITAIEIRNVDGVAGVWDTVPSSKNPAVGVALTSDPVHLLNSKDSSIAIKVKDRVQLNLYVADNGGIAGGATNYRISVTFSDGEISWCPVQKDTKKEPPTAATKVSFLPTWMGFMPTDAVGLYPGLKPDGQQDAVFGLDIDVSPRSTITGIEINNVDGPAKKWATTGTSPGAWGLAVAYQTAPTALLNKTDGAVSIPIDGRAQFFVYGADPGDLATTSQKLRMIVHLSDGSSYQQLITRPPASTSTVVPGVEEPAKAKGLINCEFRGFIADLVNTSTRPGKDGYLDGTFIMKLEVENKKLAKVDISGTDGAVRWSSDPKPPLMFLGVALYPNIFKLINEKGGTLNTPVSGRRTLYLYAADNGMLSDPRARLSVTVTFTDKTTLSTEVAK
ncbi:MAG TPA: hypothetical protein VK463_08235 [Desulfomonilaceae bacterium]|nr:hypothetical protein [Desulfomonilaceae bacterium]